MSENNNEKKLGKEMTQEIPFKIGGYYSEKASMVKDVRAKNLFNRGLRQPESFNKKAFSLARDQAKNYRGTTQGLGRAGIAFGVADVAMGVATEGWTQGLLSNGIGLASGLGAGTWVTGALMGTALAASAPAWITAAVIGGTALTVGGGVSWLVDKQIDIAFKRHKFINQLNENKQPSKWNQFSSKVKDVSTNLRKLINQPNKDFSKLEPAKLDELKQAPVQGVDETIITYPAPTVNANPLAWLGQFGNILSLSGNVLGAVGGIAAGMGTMGATKTVSAMMVGQHHTGGKVSGRDEVLAILRGGETVRTEAQEMELQEERYQQFASAVAPYIENPNRKPESIAEAHDPDNKIPCLLNKTTQDEELIISIIAKAWKSNRLGFRNILRYE